MTVFLDPLAVTRGDDEQAESEERWITVAQTDDGMLTVVAHTYHETEDTEASVRIISARRATPRGGESTRAENIQSGSLAS